MNAGRNVMRTIAPIFAAMLASACETFPFASDTTLVESTPDGAVVTVEGFGQCETPCRVKLDTPRLTTVAKAGYEKKRFMLDPDRSKVTVVLELAAPTEDVEASELPDL
ncbi:MAG: PEGA domain-containing protein [Parvularculaceae bacterium]